MQKNDKLVEVYAVGSKLMVTNGNIVGIVEKAIIGAGSSIQYQLICYPHGERTQGVFNDFEVSQVEELKKTAIGFNQTPKMEETREVTILLDENNGFVGAESKSLDVMVQTVTLSKEEMMEFPFRPPESAYQLPND